MSQCNAGREIEIHCKVHEFLLKPCENKRKPMKKKNYETGFLFL
jgi:hypothetical protein